MSELSPHGNNNCINIGQSVFLSLDKKTQYQVLSLTVCNECVLPHWIWHVWGDYQIIILFFFAVDFMKC